MEVIRGSSKQRDFILNYLNQLRENLPFNEFSRNTANRRFDLWLQECNAQKIFDRDLFDFIVRSLEHQIKEYDSTFQILPFDRYFVGEVGGQTDSDVGGFNSMRFCCDFKWKIY